VKKSNSSGHIDKRLANIDKSLIKYNAQLEYHIERTNQLENHVKEVSQFMHYMKKHIYMVQGIFLFVTAIAAIITFYFEVLHGRF